MNHYTVLKTLKRDSFEIIVDKTWEDIPLEDLFDDTCYDIEDMERKVHNGDLDWFMLRVRVLLDGHELGSHYLGGCLYEDANEVFNDGVADDCIEEALAEAMEEVRNLREKLNALLVDTEPYSPYNTLNT